MRVSAAPSTGCRPARVSRVGGAGERALAARVAELERALAVAEMRAEGAERLAAERAARIDDLRGALRMLEAAPRPADGQPRRRWWRR
jgi:hypothetical protein